MSGATTPPPPVDYSLLQHLVLFARQLRLSGLVVSPAAVIDLCHALDRIDLARHADVRAAARATLVHEREHLQVFDAIFDAYWMLPIEGQPQIEPEPRYDEETDPSGNPEGEDESELMLDTGPSPHEPEPDGDGDTDRVAASLLDTMGHRDLGSLDEHELRLALDHVRELVRSLANRPGRRFHPPHGHRGDIDLRAGLRRSLRHGFDTIEIVHRRRRIRKLRLLLLCDVSGSMARYSRFFLAFMQALSRELNNLEAAVFGTRMIPITTQLRRSGPEQWLASLETMVQGWGSGTDIGRALAEFNQCFAKHMMHSRTVVVILSDGWDRGDPRIMRNAIRELRSWSDSLVWLNPLLGQQGYQPLCRGMRTALPFLDHFLPAHDLSSLASVVARLRSF